VNLLASYEDVMAGNLLHRSKRNVSLMEQMDNEQKAFGFYFHSPSKNYAPFARYCTIRKSHMLKTFYVLAEIIIVSVRRSKTGSYAFLKLADHTGILDLTVFGGVLQQSSNLLKVGELLMFECMNEVKNGVHQYTCKRVIRFDDYLSMFSILQVSANNNHHLTTLKSIIANYANGNKKVQVMSDIEDTIISTNTCICRALLDELIQNGINIHYLL
jgi:DNA polymerase III alpha subunit